MENIESNKILERTSQENQIKQILLNFDKNKKSRFKKKINHP